VCLIICLRSTEARWEISNGDRRRFDKRGDQVWPRSVVGCDHRLLGRRSICPGPVSAVATGALPSITSGNPVPCRSEHHRQSGPYQIADHFCGGSDFVSTPPVNCTSRQSTRHARHLAGLDDSVDYIRRYVNHRSIDEKALPAPRGVECDLQFLLILAVKK